MGVLLLATAVEYYFGTVVMSIIFVGLATFTFVVAARADLARQLLSILVFRLSAQVAMTIGTGTLLLTTVLTDTPPCTSSRLRTAGWRAPIVTLLKLVIPKRWLRRVVGVEPPYGPPFLRVLASVASREWFGWVPSFGLPSILALPGTITFRPDRPAALAFAGPPPAMRPPLFPFAPAGLGASPPPPPPPMTPAGGGGSGFGWWLSGGGSEVTGVYTYACQDVTHGDFYYIFRYTKAFWMRPASFALLQAVTSLFVKMLLMHVYASLFMLLSQGNCRDAFHAELKRRFDRVRRWAHPRPPVRLIEIEAGDLCAFCHEELLRPPPTDDDEAEPRPPSRVERAFAALAQLRDGAPAAMMTRAALTRALTRAWLAWTAALNVPRVWDIGAAVAGGGGGVAETAAAETAAEETTAAAGSRNEGWPGTIAPAGSSAESNARRGGAAQAQEARVEGGDPPSGAAGAAAAGGGAAATGATAAPATKRGEASSRSSSVVAKHCERTSSSPASAAERLATDAEECNWLIHCRWGCGKAVHAACAASWGRNACVYCSAPMH